MLDGASIATHGLVAETPPRFGAPRPPRLLDRLRAAIRTRHLSRRTEEAYVFWVRRYVVFHGKRHPAELREPEVSAFLSHLAIDRHVSASTQNQALSAVLFLYRQTVQELLGHRDVRTTMIYTHVLNRGGLGVVSPVDAVLGALVGPRPAAVPGLGRVTLQLTSEERGVETMEPSRDFRELYATSLTASQRIRPQGSRRERD